MLRSIALILLITLANCTAPDPDAGLLPPVPFMHMDDVPA